MFFNVKLTSTSFFLSFFSFFLITSYSTAPRVITLRMDNVKLELEKGKVVCGAGVIEGVRYIFRVVTEGGWRGIGDTVDGA